MNVDLKYFFIFLFMCSSLIFADDSNEKLSPRKIQVKNSEKEARNAEGKNALKQKAIKKGKILKKNALRGQVLRVTRTYIVLAVLELGQDLLEKDFSRKPLKIRTFKSQVKTGERIDFIPEKPLSRQGDYWQGQLFLP